MAGATPTSGCLVWHGRAHADVPDAVPGIPKGGSAPGQRSFQEGCSAPLRGGRIASSTDRPAGVSALPQRTGRGPAENARPWAAGNVEP